MNIFAIHKNPYIAARGLVDRHVVKMALETAQILCSVYHLQNIVAPYKLSHKNHPSNIWARQSFFNFLWTLDHGLGICHEYTERYGKVHKSEAVIRWARNNIDKLEFSMVELTPFAQAMPDEFKHADGVTAYRQYYREGKKHLHSWKIESNKPNWII